jgi:ATP-binding cassette subfamily B protein
MTCKVIKNFSVKINKGDKIALIGENGRGKSTLIKILCKIY